ncbi:MAG: hypothetical protein J5657_05190 [Clostridiales bacterium]|jgi:hypothetical protein|nr:hypothetical protein [Clostridiales bacterium]
MDKADGKMKQRLKAVGIIALIVIIFGLMILAAYFVTTTIFAPVFQ